VGRGWGVVKGVIEDPREGPSAPSIRYLFMMGTIGVVNQPFPVLATLTTT
jgi:hypothetical protein